mgnify:CR=1 FL=1
MHSNPAMKKDRTNISFISIKKVLLLTNTRIRNKYNIEYNDKAKKSQERSEY